MVVQEGTLLFSSGGITQTFDCQVEAGEKVCTFFYEEQDEDGRAIRNALELLPDDTIRLTRSGAISADFTFVAGQVTDAKMQTMYGTLAFTVSTESVSVKKERQQIVCDICYRLLEAYDEIHTVRYEIFCQTGFAPAFS